MKRRYPLETLRLAKEREREASAVAALAAGEQRRRAEEIAERAREELRRDARELAVKLIAEDARVDEGVARAADLARGESYRSDAEERLRSRAAVARQREGALAQACHAENAARDELSRARGAERGIERHRAQFVAAESKGSERRDEEDAEASWDTARRGKAPRP